MLDACVARTKEIAGQGLGDQRLIDDFYLSDRNISSERRGFPLIILGHNFNGYQDLNVPQTTNDRGTCSSSDALRDCQQRQDFIACESFMSSIEAFDSGTQLFG
jgi:hypothetical protein